MSKSGEPSDDGSSCHERDQSGVSTLRTPGPDQGAWQTFEVPEKNTILRCFQYISPETIPTDASAGIRIASIAA